ncbi:hypothetical protein HYT55_02525 [Candidatus Woesearchaeota archaeon]|nr:hypothetical protein [Candidatus Woesearchaeota archaeon]
MSLEEPTPGELVLIDRFFNSSPWEGLPFNGLLKLIYTEDPRWSPLLRTKDVTAYSSLIPLPIDIPSMKSEIPLHFVVGRIHRGTPSVEDFPYLPSERREKERVGRAFRQGLSGNLYKLVVVEDQHLQGTHVEYAQPPPGMYVHHPGIEKLFTEVDHIHALRQQISQPASPKRTAAALELYLRGK